MNKSKKNKLKIKRGGSNKQNNPNTLKLNKKIKYILEDLDDLTEQNQVTLLLFDLAQLHNQYTTEPYLVALTKLQLCYTMNYVFLEKNSLTVETARERRSFITDLYMAIPLIYKSPNLKVRYSECYEMLSDKGHLGGHFGSA